HPHEEIVPSDPGIVDEERDCSTLLEQPSERGFYRRRVRDVEGQGGGRPPGGRNGLRGGRRGLARPCADDDRGASGPELQGDRPPDPARAAGDERRLPLEVAVHGQASTALSAASTPARSETVSTTVSLRMRRTRFPSTLPGPNSTNVSRPSSTIRT